MKSVKYNNNKLSLTQLYAVFFKIIYSSSENSSANKFNVPFLTDIHDPFFLKISRNIRESD